MNYLYIYIGKLPEYIKYSINSVMSVDKDANIYLCTNEKSSYKNCNLINLNEIKSKKIDYLTNNNYFQNTNYENNPLWINSLLRILYLEKIAENYNIDSFVHFDSDIIVYESFDKLRPIVKNNLVNITQHTLDQLIFGYSFFPNLEITKLLCKEVDLIIKNIEKHMDDNFGHPLNEMDILGKIFNFNSNIFNTLPILPYEKTPYVFDPASYGQYFGGTAQKPRKTFSIRVKEEHHIVGKEILSKRIKPKMINNEPYVFHNNEKYKIVNLHIHSKQLNKFLPNNYKNYV